MEFEPRSGSEGYAVANTRTGTPGAKKADL
jgi:hypothetical protein